MLSDYIILPDSEEELHQDEFYVMYDSSQYYIPARNTGINYCVVKNNICEKEYDCANSEEEVLTFSI